MPVDLRSFESQVYPKIDAEGMRGKHHLEMKFELGERNEVEVKIRALDAQPLTNERKVKAEDFNFSANFWVEGSTPWYRIDTEYFDRDTNRKMLHFHLESEEQSFSEHVPLPEDKPLSELVSYAFEEARKFLAAKNVEISAGKGFCGFA